MIDRNAEWSNLPPGTHAADLVADFLDGVIELIRNGKHREAQSDLRGEAWTVKRDVRDLPNEVKRQVQSYIDIAWDALRHPVQVDAALKALQLAKQAVNR